MHVRRAVESHISALRRAPARHVAERGLGLPGDDPAAGRARHPVDRHRRGDPRLLDAAARSAATAGATSAIPSCSTGPGRCARASTELAIVFRDHSMSDQVGFHYQRSPGPVAAADFLGKVARHRRRLPPRTPRRWSRSSSTARTAGSITPTAACRSSARSTRARPRDPRVRPVNDRRVPPRASAAPTRLPRLFAGSWISHNFAIWIGHPEDNRGWDALHADPRVPRRRGAVAAGTTRRRSAEAWEEIYIAEGSDWFWWYGDDHSSALDALFDHLFRKHLRNVYTLLGLRPARHRCSRRSRRRRSHRPLHDQPTAS